MKLALAIFLVAVAASASAANVTRCVIGERVTFNGSVVLDNAVMGPCADPSAECVKFTYNQVSEQTVQVEFGACMYANRSYGCDQVAEFNAERGYGTVNSCMMQNYASGDTTVFKTFPGENCDARKAEDLQVFPSCSFRQVLEKMSACSDQYYRSFPYEDKEACGNNVDMMVQCFAAASLECASGRCPTVFTEIPGELEKLQMQREFSLGINDVDSALASAVFLGFFNDTTGYKEMILAVMCPTPGEMPDFVAMMPSLLNPSNFSVLIGDFGLYPAEVEAFFSAIPCSEHYYTAIAEMHAAAVTGFYAAESHDDLCRTYSQYYNTAITSFLTKCNVMGFNEAMFEGVASEEMRPWIEGIMQASTIWGEFFYSYRLPGCEISVDYATSCVTGERVWINGTALYDYTVATPCSSTTDKCLSFEYTTMSGGDSIRVQGGACIPEMGEYNCSMVKSYSAARGYGEVISCNTSTCNGSYCNDLEATPAEGCGPLASSNDVQIFPGCTMMESFQMAYECHEKFYASFPYENRDNCGKNASKFVECMANMHNTCLAGRCPTVLDAVPGLRSMYPTIREITMDLKTIEQAAERMVLLGLVNEETAMAIVGYFYAGMCPEVTDLPSMIEAWVSSVNTTMLVEWFASMDINYVAVQANMPCSLSYFTGIASAYQTMVEKVFMSGFSRDGICSAYDSYFTAVTTSYVENCDESKMIDFLYAIMPESCHIYVPYMAQFGAYIGKTFYENPRLPMCGDEPVIDHGHGHKEIEINCEHLYESTSRCGMKKAWLCDYAKWKVEFLGSWLAEFANYQSESMMGLDMSIFPECVALSEFNGMCKNRNKRECFSMPVVDCPMCYCSDHQYSDLSGLTQIWRYDYTMWRKFFSAYRYSFTSGSGSGSMSGSCDV